MGGKNLIFKGVFYKTKYIFLKLIFLERTDILGFKKKKKKKKKKKTRK
jgi:hypothetical protein